MLAIVQAIDVKMDGKASWSDGVAGELSVNVKVSLELAGALAKANSLAQLFCYSSPAAVIDLKFSMRAKMSTSGGFEITTVPSCTFQIVDLDAVAPTADATATTDAAAAQTGLKFADALFLI